MSTARKLIFTLSFLISLAYAGRVVWRAHRNLVTLDVREMDVRQVVRKISRQTWETILIPQDVAGKVTLRVQNAPLDSVLDLIAGQVSARSSHVYPVFKNSASLQKLQTLVQQPSTTTRPEQWTNFNYEARPPRDFASFGRTEPATNSTITLDVLNKDSRSAARALSSAGRVQVVPEDTAVGSVSFYLRNASREKALDRFAKALNAQWDDFYLLQPVRVELAQRRPGDERRENRGPDPETMPVEQRTRMEEMRNLTPQERQTRMQARMEDPVVQQKMTERALTNIRNSTPEQMVQRQRERQKMMQRRQQEQPGQPRTTIPNRS